jgi:hypothetical protein
MQSWFQSFILVGSIALGIGDAAKRITDRMPRAFAEWLEGFHGLHIVGLCAALCCAFALTIFWRTIDPDTVGGHSSESSGTDPPFIYWQAVAMSHCGLLFVIATWLSAGREHIEAFDQGQGEVATLHLGTRVGRFAKPPPTRTDNE